ncbi:MAG: type I-C CRISPR-associated protein Cas5c [Deltaproteobacteria bacterium]|nr:type I-C CRISPR-associated protein Cas5c [Deltaproteobacteria bacterium]
MKGFCLEVSGDYACFTRPEMKVERVSYDVITPSAARAVFDAILWKPAIYWQVKKIEVLSPVKWISVRRNEVGKVASPRSEGIFIEVDRQQRAGLFLRDVKYRLHAEFIFIPPEKRSKVFNPVPEWLVDTDEVVDLKKPDDRKDETEAKYAAMFERRARKGQHFHQPYLGCREFAAAVQLVDPGTEPIAPISETRDLGWMLYDMDYSDPGDIKPMFYQAKMKSGIICVPPPDSEEVRR